MKYGKKYADSLKAYDHSKAYDVDEAMGIVIDTAKAKVNVMMFGRNTDVEVEYSQIRKISVSAEKAEQPKQE